MDKKTIKCKGNWFQGKANSEEEFDTLIENGLIGSEEIATAFLLPCEQHIEFRCDIPKGKDYIKAFIYSDLKVLGKYHFSTSQGYIPVELNADFYSDEDGIFTIFGKLFYEKELYFIELNLFEVKET